MESVNWHNALELVSDVQFSNRERDGSADFTSGRSLPKSDPVIPMSGSFNQISRRRDRLGPLSLVDTEPHFVGDWLARVTPCIVREVKDDAKILAIHYPLAMSGKIRRFFYEGDRLMRVETVSKEEIPPVVFQYDKSKNRWLMNHDGVSAILPGRVALTNRGVLHVQTGEHGVCRIEHPSGSIEHQTDCCTLPGERRSTDPKPEGEIKPASDLPIGSIEEALAATSEGELRLLSILSSISHDLRSPLTSIQGLLTLLSAGAFGELPEKATDRIQNVELDLSRLIRLTNELLDAEQLVTGRLVLNTTSCKVQDLFTTTISCLSGISAQRRIRILFSATDLSVETDRDRILRVMVNLVTNALKYSPEESIVSLSADCENNQVTIKIKDSGIGIPARFQQSIFERFKQVPGTNSNKKEGYGLGLAISKSIVEAHGGAIGVQSRPGYGSTFWMRLPLCPLERI